jgi:hypothetical protein
MVAAIRGVCAGFGGVPLLFGMRASMQLPRRVHSAAGLKTRWASERVTAKGNGASLLEMAGLVLCLVSAQWRRVCSAIEGTCHIFQAATSSHELLGSRLSHSSKTYLDLAAILKACVENTVGRVVGLDDPLADMGIDSVTWVEVRNSVQLSVGQQIDVSEFVEAFTLSSLAQQLFHMLERSLAYQDGEVAASALPTSATSANLAVAPKAALEESALMRTLRPRRDVAVSVQPLFLGAPAFGDGSLAYLSLTKELEVALPTWNQAIVTLKRDSNTLWPTLAAAHAKQVTSLQPDGRYLLGGHSLGGLLALETAICLEHAHRESVGVVFLLDSSHPQQFKVEWLETPPDAVDTTKQHDEKEHALRQVMVMMKAVNFDFDDVHWKALKIDEKFKVFEDLSFQARPA